MSLQRSGTNLRCCVVLCVCVRVFYRPLAGRLFVFVLAAGSIKVSEKLSSADRCLSHAARGFTTKRQPRTL